jgi:hypothetical protein
MIDKIKDPIGWAALMYEMEDAHEHLTQLISDLNNNPDYDEVVFQIALGHVYSHLNRAWYKRNIPEDFPADQWETASQFPKDIEPV